MAGEEDGGSHGVVATDVVDHTMEVGGVVGGVAVVEVGGAHQGGVAAQVVQGQLQVKYNCACILTLMKMGDDFSLSVSCSGFGGTSRR